MITLISKQDWIEMVKSHSTHGYQFAPEYLDFLTLRGEKSIFFQQTIQAKTSITGMAHSLQSFAGPLLVIPNTLIQYNASVDDTVELLSWLKEYAKKHHYIGIKITTALFDHVRAPLRRSTKYLSLEDTVIVPVHFDVQSILNNCNEITRRKLKKANKLLESNEITLDMSQHLKQEDYHLYEKLSKQKSFSGLPYRYMQQELASFADNAFVIRVTNHQQTLSWGIFFVVGKCCYYRHGANQQSSIPSAHLVQWHAILEAKRRGCDVFDMMGATPRGANSAHKWSGITQFKLGFGGTIEHLGTTYETPVATFRFLLYQLVNKLKAIRLFS